MNNSNQINSQADTSRKPSLTVFLKRFCETFNGVMRHK
jgi:hypothetical protein